RLSAHPPLLEKLAEQIENLYVNNFVLKLGDRFQEFVGQMEVWKVPSVRRQDKFFETWVQPFLRKEIKICVIISDALRYEVGEELQQIIRREDKFTAELSPMISMLPSYTQLGMAALLPHKELTITKDGSVLADGQPSSGTDNRAKILQAALKGRGQAIQAEKFMALGRDEARDILKASDVLYIYHDRIDDAGRKEDKVFVAARETIDELTKIIKKLAGNNISNMLVTADHGFLYQTKDIAESDYADFDVQGEEILDKTRRFVLGRGLAEAKGGHTFTSSQLGLAGDVEVQIPKSIKRLRLKGAGSRYVHGGATLQEVVLPVIKINKKRQSDTDVVPVDILDSSGSSITSGQLAVILYQREAVTDKMRPRTLRAGIYTENGSLISDNQELIFDSASENSRDREQKVRLILSREADKANGQEVLLKLEEKLPGTSHYQQYASRRYLLRRSFATDFDL
ncbi:MAG: BREX-1 system phosphatase PglZ type A, partial [Peptococcaceae bacterium]|nr:BREX-1 system phosphatase PglZ type A [Peptococcaceae bacterium]